MRYTSSQFEDDLNAQRLEGALTFDAAASLKLGRRFALALRGENLTDKRVPGGDFRRRHHRTRHPADVVGRTALRGLRGSV